MYRLMGCLSKCQRKSVISKHCQSTYHDTLSLLIWVGINENPKWKEVDQVDVVQVEWESNSGLWWKAPWSKYLYFSLSSPFSSFTLFSLSSFLSCFFFFFTFFVLLSLHPTPDPPFFFLFSFYLSLPPFLSFVFFSSIFHWKLYFFIFQMPVDEAACK